MNEVIEKKTPAPIPFTKEDACKPVTLNDIMRNYHELEDMLVETFGEVTPNIEAFMFWLDEMLEDKLDGYADFIAYLKGQIEFFKDLQNQFAKRQKSLDNTVQWLRGKVLNAILERDLKKLKTKKHSFSIRETESVKVNVENMNDSDKKWFVDSELAEFTFKPILSAIKNELKKGWDFDSISLEKKQSVTIR